MTARGSGSGKTACPMVTELQLETKGNTRQLLPCVVTACLLITRLNEMQNDPISPQLEQNESITGLRQPAV
ncbi:hypothetical protein JZ751_023609 [Albula glossodonta]|uniref:Uncharacterized protein n=1 Tax=Albula glossodonta TaxID=121402 RepID=A0A8T2NKD6_9TELE|nr:hypothetical protein JZ751_023609 [Albula glossodonta]